MKNKSLHVGESLYCVRGCRYSIDFFHENLDGKFAIHKGGIYVITEITKIPERIEVIDDYGKYHRFDKRNFITLKEVRLRKLKKIDDNKK